MGVVGSWVCPNCNREFARVRQGHECAPAMTLDEYFATGPEFERPIFQAVHGFVSTLGPVSVEPVSVGLFVKKQGGWIELRPKTKWVDLCFPFPRRIDHALIARKPIETGRFVYHYVKLRSPEDFTEEVQAWLAESYDAIR